MRNKKTIISLSFIILLALAHTAFYHWAKGKFLKTHASLVQDLTQEGFTIQENAPITFSGFPFKLIAHQENFKAVRRTQKGYTEIDSIHATASASILNPLKWEVKSSIQIQGLMTPLGLPILQAKLTKKELTINAGFNSNDKNQPIEVDLMVPHLVVKLKPGITETNIRSLKLYDFKVKWADPKIRHVQYAATGEMAKCTHKPYAEDSLDGHYTFRFHNLDIQKFDAQAKWQGHVSLPNWKVDIKVKQFKELHACLNMVNTAYKKANISEKASAKVQHCAMSKIFADNKSALNAINSTLEITSKIKRDEGILNVSAIIYKKEDKVRLKLDTHMEQADAIAIDLVNILTQPLPHALEIFKNALQKTGPVKDWKMEIDLVDMFAEYYQKSC